MEPTFRVGDLAVYPAHGVAQIVGIETREISANKQTFYILKILENGMKIMIPTRNAGAVGLRELIRADEVDEVFEILKSREVAVEGQTWNRRYREYMEKIKTGRSSRSRRFCATCSASRETKSSPSASARCWT